MTNNYRGTIIWNKHTACGQIPSIKHGNLDFLQAEVDYEYHTRMICTYFVIDGHDGFMNYKMTNKMSLEFIEDVLQIDIRNIKKFDEHFIEMLIEKMHTKINYFVQEMNKFHNKNNYKNQKTYMPKPIKAPPAQFSLDDLILDNPAEFLNYGEFKKRYDDLVDSMKIKDSRIDELLQEIKDLKEDIETFKAMSEE